MNIKEYETTLTDPMKQATIVLLIREDEVLLAMKKRGFGVGKWNGVGGKPNPGEAIEAAAVRESEEEIEVTPLKPKKTGVLNFYFPHKPEWSQQVLVFTATEWNGEPAETEEMKPQWFKQDEVPYDEMWWDDKIWMPKVFAGILIRAGFVFDENEKVLDHYLDEVEAFT